MWYLWQQEWLLNEKVEFDGINRLIIVHPNVIDLNIREDVYQAWVRWLPLQENTKFLPAIRYTGFDPIPGGFTGDSYFLINGWRLVIDITKVKVDGLLFSEDYDTGYFDNNLVSVYPAKVSSLFSVIAPTVNIDGIDIPTAQEIADTVRVEIQPELTHMMTLQNGAGLNSVQATMLLELYRMAGLDPTKPLVVTNTSRIIGAEINQNIESTGTSTTVTRV